MGSKTLTPRGIMFSAMAFVMTAMALGFFLNLSFSSLSLSADRMDDERAIAATEGAVRAFGKQLGSTIRDNAYWDDAYAAMNSPERGDFIVKTWGSVSEDYPLYDAVAVLSADGKTDIAYYHGAKLPSPRGFFDGSVDLLLARARLAEARMTIPVSFIVTREGLMLVGAAAIQPQKAVSEADLARTDTLLMAKLITPAVIADLGDNFLIHGLRLDRAPVVGQLGVILRNPLGEPLAALNWPPSKPGSKSFEKAKPAILAVVWILLALLGGIVCAAFVFVLDLRKREAAARFDAAHDALTALTNRAGLMERIEECLADAESRDIHLHVLGLDNFKSINETWGHAVGDALLVAIANRLSLRFPDALCLSRLGGDEFALLSSGHRGSDIQASFKEPCMLMGRSISIGVSIGIAAKTEIITSAAELMRQADLALHRAKADGRSRVLDFMSAFDQEDEAQRQMERDLRLAIDRCEIEVVYQPIIATGTREVVGVEALARWSHPERGPIRPDIFVGVAEKGGLVDDLGRLVLCKSLIALRDRTDIWVSVNVSPLQLRNSAFANELEYLLRELDFDPARLILEVTESAVISEPDQAKRNFAHLKALGIRIALDDFGCGYASVGALREFGFDKMKLDRSLTVIEDSRGATLLNATVAMASALGLPVTAEGVETLEQATIMETVGCSDMQGYLFSRPIPLDGLQELLDHRAAELVHAA